MINPMVMLAQFKNAKNPMNLIQNMIPNNPLLARAAQMAQGKSPAELETTAKNLCSQMGINFDNAMKQMESIGFKFPK